MSGETCHWCGKPIRRDSGRWKLIQFVPWEPRVYFCDDYCLQEFAPNVTLQLPRWAEI